MTSYDLSGTAAWTALRDEHATLAATNLRELFAADPTRGERLTADAGELHLDFSKNLVTDSTISALVALADEAGLQAKIDAMFAGEHINVTEDRAVLHTALRLPRDAKLDRKSVV